MRLKVLNNPIQTIGKTGKLTIRVENIGYSRANNLHFDVGGSLLNPICFDMVAPLDPDHHCDLSFEISATRENDTVKVEISYIGKGHNIPFHINLDIIVQAKKVTTIKMDGMVKSEVRIINDDGNDMEIIAQDMVFSQLQIINKK